MGCQGGRGMGRWSWLHPCPGRDAEGAQRLDLPGPPARQRCWSQHLHVRLWDHRGPGQGHEAPRRRGEGRSQGQLGRGCPA
eukprot:6961886-Heterocapsa_arctica.AAC.1